MATKVGIIDYGMGNLQSVRNAFEYLGVQVDILSDSKDLSKVSHMVLPGVGSFAEGMKNLRSAGWDQALLAIHGKKPFLGICLGMQLMADKGSEGGDSEGLGLIPGSVSRLQETGLRIPHVGWNNIQISTPGKLFNEQMAVDYYFVHSYKFETAKKEHVIATCDYGETFCCVAGSDEHLSYGVQFHPEKSHHSGLRILKQFLKLNC